VLDVANKIDAIAAILALRDMRAYGHLRNMKRPWSTLKQCSTWGPPK
jgi:hypothetical protein